MLSAFAHTGSSGSKAQQSHAGCWLLLKLSWTRTRRNVSQRSSTQRLYRHWQLCAISVGTEKTELGRQVQWLFVRAPWIAYILAETATFRGPFSELIRRTGALRNFMSFHLYIIAENLNCCIGRSNQMLRVRVGYKLSVLPKILGIVIEHDSPWSHVARRLSINFTSMWTAPYFKQQHKRASKA